MPITGFSRVQTFLGLIYLCAGSAKLLGADIMVEAFDATGLGQSLRVAVGVLEICGGLCLFVPRASIYAAGVLGCTIVAFSARRSDTWCRWATSSRSMHRE